MTVFLTAENGQCFEDLAVAATSVGEDAVPVVGRLVSVQGYADLDLVLTEQTTPLLVQQQPVAMNAQVKAGYRVNLRSQLVEQRTHSGHAGQQRLAAVQDYEYVGELMRDRMLADSPRCHRGGVRRDNPRLRPPALVGVLIDITVVAGQVAPAMDFQYVL